MTNQIKKWTISLAAITALASVASADATIKITSWEAIGATDSQIAEVCGVVTGVTQNPIMLEVVPDYDTKEPGAYHTFAGSSGNFCEVVRTLNGTIQVTMMSSPASLKVTARFK